MTAVEWLISELKNYDRVGLKDQSNYVIEMPTHILTELEEQAKELEKQQIIDARNDGFYISGEGWNGEYGVENFDEEVNSKQYYNETFNK